LQSEPGKRPEVGIHGSALSPKIASAAPELRRTRRPEAYEQAAATTPDLPG
jgi:hypothetical protein